MLCHAEFYRCVFDSSIIPFPFVCYHAGFTLPRVESASGVLLFPRFSAVQEGIEKTS